MKCPKCQSTKLVTGNAGLMTLIPFLYCPVCKVEAIEDVPPPPPPPTIEVDGWSPWTLGVVQFMGLATYRVSLPDGEIVSGFLTELYGDGIDVGDDIEVRYSPRLNGVIPLIHKSRAPRATYTT